MAAVSNVVRSSTSLLDELARAVSLSATAHDSLAAEANEAQQQLHRDEQGVLARVRELKVHGLWTPHRLPKVAEPPRHQTHWDYLLKEMEWMSNDFRMERRWKISAAQKISKAVKKCVPCIELCIELCTLFVCQMFILCYFALLL